MGKFFQIESINKEKSTAVVYSQMNPLCVSLLENLSKSLKVVYVTKLAQKFNNENILIVNPNKFSESVQTQIDYAVIFLLEEEDKKLILPIIDKAEKEKAKILVVVKIREVENFLDIIYFLKKKPRTYFILIGDLFGKNITSGSACADLINTAIKSKTVSLTGNDLTAIYPISLEDAQKGIGQALFGPEQENKIHYLFYEHPQTIISSIHLIKRVESDLEIKFSLAKKEYISNKNLREIEELIKLKLFEKPYFFDINYYGFENSVKRIIDGTDYYTVKDTRLNNNNSNKRSKSAKNKLLNFTLFIVFVFISYLILNILIFAVSVFSFKQAISSAQKNDYKNMVKYSLISNLTLSTVEAPVEMIGRLVFPGKYMKEYELFKKAVSIATVASNRYADLSKIMDLGKIPDSQLLVSDIDYIYFELQKIKLENPEQKKNLEKILSKSNLQFIPFLQILPAILNLGDKNYLFLFQNNAELRPTGGFIGSVAELKISNNKISDFVIRDVYELDGQLKAHVEPHYIVRRYLQPHLYLRDSNFALNFEETASTSALLYNLETKQKVDAVVAVDFEILKRFIKVFGPIKLFDYNKILDEQNAFEYIQDTIQKGNFPGSQEKKSILSSIFDQILIRVKDGPSILFKFTEFVPNLIQEKHILFAFRDNTIQPLFTLNNFSDSYRDLRIETEDTFYDLLSINEANIASNKANLTIKRSIDYKVYLGDKSSSVSAVLNILNSDEKSKDYFAYIRFVAPLNSKVTSVKIDGVEKKTVDTITDYKIYEKKGFKPPQDLELENSVYDNKQVFGLVTKVLKGKNQKIEVDYSNASLLPSNLKNYNLLFIKQPGTDPYPLKVNLVYQDKSGTTSIKSFDQDISTDQEINFNLK